MRKRTLAAFVALVAACLAAATFAAAQTSKHKPSPPAPKSGQHGKGGSNHGKGKGKGKGGGRGLGGMPPVACAGGSSPIKHLVYVQFDNTHLLRDRPNVPSDLEQMPHLLNFMRQNGTLMTNDHTVLISHTAGGILSSLTGVYPDNHGQAVSNSFRYYNP